MNYLICAVAMLVVAGGAFAQGTPPTQETPAPKAVLPTMETPPAKGARGLGGGKRSQTKDDAYRDDEANRERCSQATELPGRCLMNAAERAEHRKRLENFKTASECKTYMADHLAKMEARAKEQQKTVRKPRMDVCAQMEKAAAKSGAPSKAATPKS